MENAVNAIPHQYFRFHRLYVNVRGALHYGVAQKSVHYAHYRQVFCHLLKLIVREVLIPFCDNAYLPRLGRNNVSEFVLQRLLVLQESMLNTVGVGKSR